MANSIWDDYIQQTWVNNSTPITAESLNYIEQGIYYQDLKRKKEIGDTEERVLWTNSNPLASFSSQSVYLSDGDYTSLKIVFYDWTNSALRRMKTIEIPKLSANEKAFIDCIFETDQNFLYWATRTITGVNDTQLNFSNTRGANASTHQNTETINAVCVPIKIIGCYNLRVA